MPYAKYKYHWKTKALVVINIFRLFWKVISLDCSPRDSWLRSNGIQKRDVLMLVKKWWLGGSTWCESHLASGGEYGVIESGAEQTKKYERGIKKRRGWLLKMNLSCFRICPGHSSLFLNFQSSSNTVIKYHLFPTEGYDTAYQFRSEMKYQGKQTGIKSENTR